MVLYVLVTCAQAECLPRRYTYIYIYIYTYIYIYIHSCGALHACRSSSSRSSRGRSSRSRVSRSKSSRSRGSRNTRSRNSRGRSSRSRVSRSKSSRNRGIMNLEYLQDQDAAGAADFHGRWSLISNLSLEWVLAFGVACWPRLSYAHCSTPPFGIAGHVSARAPPPPILVWHSAIIRLDALVMILIALVGCKLTARPFSVWSIFGDSDSAAQRRTRRSRGEEH